LEAARGLTIFLILALGACSSAPKVPVSDAGAAGPLPEMAQQDAKPPEPMGPPEPFGPPIPERQPEFGPDPVKTKAIVLVLGPGFARAFAHAGVLKAFDDAKIPVSAIYASETAALVAAMYGLSETVNAFEWRMMKIKDNALVPKKSLVGKIFHRKRNKKWLDGALEEAIGEGEFKDSRTRLRIGAKVAGTGESGIFSDGSIFDAVRAAMAVPGYAEPAPVNGREMLSSGDIRPLMVPEAKREGDVVVAVDVLGPAPLATREPPEFQTYLKSAQAASEEAGQADVVIRPELGAMGIFDFSKRSEAEFKGRRAAAAVLDDVRKLVGFPAGGEAAR